MPSVGLVFQLLSDRYVCQVFCSCGVFAMLLAMESLRLSRGQCARIDEKGRKTIYLHVEIWIIISRYIIRLGIQIVFRCHEEYELETWTGIGLRSCSDNGNRVLCRTNTRHIQSNNSISQRECSQKYRRSNPKHRILGIGFSGILIVPETATLRKRILTSLLQSSDSDVFTNPSLCI